MKPDIVKQLDSLNESEYDFDYDCYIVNKRQLFHIKGEARAALYAYGENSSACSNVGETISERMNNASSEAIRILYSKLKLKSRILNELVTRLEVEFDC